MNVLCFEGQEASLVCVFVVCECVFVCTCVCVCPAAAAVEGRFLVQEGQAGAVLTLCGKIRIE